MSREPVTFHLGAPADGRWTARAGLELLGKPVRYGKLGKVGEVVGAVPTDSGRALRLTASLTRDIADLDRRGFTVGKR
jgi:hypothetical protein